MARRNLHGTRMNLPTPNRLRLLTETFATRFGDRQDKIMVRSPGRINLIGEHTDYNEGFVLPAAIDRAIWFVVAPRADGQFHFVAADLHEDFVCTRTTLRKSAQAWPNYLMGVLEQISKAGRELPGCEGVFGGDVPIGAGLSSSAAITAGFAFALNALFELGFDRQQLVRLAQKAENEFVGVQCGIMDQFINLFGREQQVLQLDCRTLAYEYFPFAHEGVCFVLCDTGVRRRLAASEYNVRRRQCESGVAVLRRHQPAVQSLRDVSLEMLAACRPELEPVSYQRCAYVIRENARVLAACEALLHNDLQAFGALMFESHAGLRDEYEVSCRELDLLVEIARGVPGVLGSRMMGAGFGGCTLNLVEKDRLAQFEAAVHAEYRRSAGRPAVTHVVHPSAGTECLAP